jgi:hypothetical protein
VDHGIWKGISNFHAIAAARNNTDELKRIGPDWFLTDFVNVKVKE